MDCVFARRVPLNAGNVDKLREMKDSFAVRDLTLDGVVLEGVSSNEDKQAHGQRKIMFKMSNF